MNDQILFWGPLDPMVDRGLTCIQQLSRFFICFAKNDITPIQFNAKTLTLVIHFFQKRILMTFDHVRATFLLECSCI